VGKKEIPNPLMGIGKKQSPKVARKPNTFSDKKL